MDEEEEEEAAASVAAAGGCSGEGRGWARGGVAHVRPMAWMRAWVCKSIWCILDCIIPIPT